MRKIICIDFDGCLHSYTSQAPWDPTKILDPPVPGMIPWLGQLLADPRFEPVIYSSRSQQEGGIEAMRAWLLKNGLSEEMMTELKFPTQKPPAWLTIDDRAIQFVGRPIPLEEMFAFVPWNRPKRAEKEPGKS